MAPISLPQIKQVLAAGDAVPKILAEALPAMQQAGTRIDDFVRVATTETSIGVVWNDAALARGEVRSLLSSAEKVLRRVEAEHLPKAGVGPASDAVVGAQAALSEVRLARAALNETLDVHVGQFGGVHATLQPRHVEATSQHLSRAVRATEGALRAHVNAAG